MTPTRFLITSALFAGLASVALSNPENPAVTPEKEATSTTAVSKETKAPAKKSTKRAKRKSAITPADYGRWESLRSGDLSSDGRWFVYSVGRVDKTQTLQLLDLQAAHKRKPVATFEQGGNPVFSEDSQWLVVSISKTPDEMKKQEKEAKASGGKPPSSPGSPVKLRHLRDGKTTELDSVLSLNFSKDSRFVAFEIGAKAGENPTPGRALIVRNLKTGIDTTFGNVTQRAWSDEGSLLAMVIDSPGISNTLQVFDPHRGTLRTLDSSDQNYSALSWREDAMDLVATREMKHGKDEDVSHVLLAWRNLDKAKRRNNKAAMVFDHLARKDFSDSQYVAGGTPKWTKDGKGVLVDLRDWEEKPKELSKENKDNKEAAEDKKSDDDKKPEEEKDVKVAENAGKPTSQNPEDKKDTEKNPEAKKLAEKKPADKKTEEKKVIVAKPLRESLEEDSNVEVWHAKDVEIMPMQKKQATMEDNPRRQAIWWPEENKLVPLANELTEKVEVLRQGNHAMGLDYTPHEQTAKFGPQLKDVYLIDTTNGERKRILEGVEFLLNASPDGAWLLYVCEGDVWSYQVATGKITDLTSKLDTSFTDQQDDSLAKEKKPYSEGQWLADSSGVLLDDRFNIWRITPDGSTSRRLTDGEDEMIRYRISSANFTPDDDVLLDPKRPLYLALYGERSKKSGYARMSLNDEKSPEVLVWEDRFVSSLSRAEKNENVFTFKKESYRDSPDLFLAGPDLKKPKALTHTNPFQKQFRWGRSELVDYVNENGVKLQGSLIYPANFKKGRKYPMVTYIYERLSQNLHRYAIPSETHPYNPAVLSAEGYFVFMPDIVYRPQEPGPSAVECIVPGVKAVLATGMVDPKRVALIGHSWGAYQTAYTVSHTDVFAAGVAGAPLTNMMSMSMQVYWNSGSTNARIFGISQGRMDKPFWRDVDNYILNSPIYGMDHLDTPLLVAFGDKDGAVDFSQGVEMYNAARLAGKDNFVMLVYPGENHSLGREENQVDYHYRILEWLGHFLKDEKAPKWITEGKTFIERENELQAKKKAKMAEGEKKTPAGK